MRPTGGRNAALAALATASLLAACERGPDIADPAVCRAAPPELLATSVAANPHNVLSAVATARVRGVDSVVARFGLRDSEEEYKTTPAVVVSGDSLDVPVLGLLAGTEYVAQLVAYGACAKTVGLELYFATGALPTDLPHYVATGSSASGNYVVMAAGQYGLVIDTTGRVVWYRRFPSGPGLNFQAQPTNGGRYVARPPTSSAEVGRFIELDPLGRETRTIGCARGLQTRFHDMIAQPDGSSWLLCDETRTMDLSALGGVASAKVTGTVVQHVSDAGDLLFEWSPFEHFAITDLDPADRTGASVNWTHANAFDLDTDGNLLVSFRSLNEVTKIDTRTGDVVWRMGGRANQFTFEGGDTSPFAGQHGVRVAGPGELVLLDNLGIPNESRAERYVYDAASRTARLVAAYFSMPAVVAQLGGATQELADGRTLVAFGNGGRVEEYDAQGNVVWRIEGNAGYVYRAQRIQSLYHPGVGSPR